jgi:hypothetical protein
LKPVSSGLCLVYLYLREQGFLRVSVGHCGQAMGQICGLILILNEFASQFRCGAD